MDCEEQLVKQALSGDEEAFRQLIEKYKAYIFAIILNFVPDHFEAENAAQDAFLQIYRSLPQYRFNSFKSWIGRIAANKGLDWQRSRKRKKVQQAFPLDPHFISILSPQAAVQGMDYAASFSGTANVSNPETIYLQREEINRIRNLCAKLPDIYRNTIEEFYLQGKTQFQIAEEEHTTIKTVESRLYRARKMLRIKWEEGD